MAINCLRKFRVVLSNPVYLAPIPGDCDKPIIKLHLKIAAQNRYTKRRQDNGHSVILYNVKVHFVHDELFVFQRKVYQTSLVFSGRFR